MISETEDKDFVYQEGERAFKPFLFSAKCSQDQKAISSGRYKDFGKGMVCGKKARKYGQSMECDNKGKAIEARYGMWQ